MDVVLRKNLKLHDPHLHNAVLDPHTHESLVVNLRLDAKLDADGQARYAVRHAPTEQASKTKEAQKAEATLGYIYLHDVLKFEHKRGAHSCALAVMVPARIPISTRLLHIIIINS